ncbi:MAG: NUDIX hydrolase [Suilimivivens sp.]
MRYEMNAIVVLNKEKDKLLFCKRRKEPFKGLYNFVGGKIKSGEDHMTAAYRELCEETGITEHEIELMHFMDFTYYTDEILLEIYVGRLNRNFEVHGEENELIWLDENHNFFDKQVFAGNGNIGHILECIRKYETQKKVCN